MVQSGGCECGVFGKSGIERRQVGEGRTEEERRGIAGLTSSGEGRCGSRGDGMGGEGGVRRGISGRLVWRLRGGRIRGLCSWMGGRARC